MFILINSWIIPSLNPNKYLANRQVYDPCHNPFSPTLHLSLFLCSLSLSLCVWPTLHSFPFSIKDVSCFWEASLNKWISMKGFSFVTGSLTKHLIKEFLKWTVLTRPIQIQMHLTQFMTFYHNCPVTICTSERNIIKMSWYYFRLVNNLNQPKPNIIA
jgi:hypothetical protein